MPGPVLISSSTGSGHPADEAVLAAALRLLDRGSWGTVRILSQDIACTGRAHPSVDIFSEDELETALDGCRLLMIVGDLSRQEARRRAAHHLLSAKLQKIPVALVSVRLRSSCVDARQDDDALRLLAEAESITTCDATSAAIMSRCMRRRVATTAPLELVLSARPVAHAAGVLALEGEYLEELPETERRVILETVTTFAARHDMRATVVFANKAPSFALPAALECVAAPTWTQWMRALSQVRICIARPDSVALHLAVAQGAVPISQAQEDGGDLSERIGLHSFTAGMCPRSWRSLLEQALETRTEDVCARSAPVRVVAWRALGCLSEAVRSRPLALDQDADLRRSCMRILQPHWRGLLENGAAAAVECQLEAWRACHAETVWAVSRAHVLVLQGRDAEAREILEEALTTSPRHADCLALLAMILWRAGDSQAADRCWSRIVDSGGLAADNARRQQEALRTWMTSRHEALPQEGAPVDPEPAALPDVSTARRSAG